MSVTLAESIDRFGVDVQDHLDREELIPVNDGLVRQGDVIVIPQRMIKKPLPTADNPVPQDGFPVVRGENGGNTHMLLADGDVRFNDRPVSATNLALGVLTVAVGSTAYLAHPEHGYLGIASGTYEIRRQREQADELRLVAD